MKRSPRTGLVTTGLTLVLLASVAVKAQVSDARLRDLMSQASAQLPITPASDQTKDARPVVALTLDDAVRLALERNLDIAVQRLNPQTYDFTLAGLRSSYRPTVSSTLGLQSSTNPSTQTISGAAAGTGIVNEVTDFSGSLVQDLPWGGGSLSVVLNNNRRSTTSLTALFNPVYNTNWSAQYTQPLLRGFRIDNTRQQLAITLLNQEISEIQLQASIINIVSNVGNAYWDYVFAVQSVDVARSSVELAERLVRDNQTRVEVGTMAPIDIVQAQSQAATQRQNLAQVEGTRLTAELALKRLIVSGTQDPNWMARIDPVDRPEFVAVPVDVEAAIRRALANRTDLAQARKNLQVNDVALNFLRGQTLPQLDLTARYGLIGQGGTQFISSGSGINRIVTGVVPGGYGDALLSVFDARNPTWNIGLSVSYPIGSSQADANLARARVQLSQVEAQLRQIELQVAAEVTNAATQAQNNVQRVQAAQAAREFAERQREAEQTKFEVGTSTNYFVVQAQRDLATAQNNELQAVLAYRRTLVELERLQQTALQNSNITIVGR